MATKRLRGKVGKFYKRNKSSKKRKSTSLRQVLHDHRYGEAVQDAEKKFFTDSEGWKTGRRVVELGVLLNINLLTCKRFRLGPVPLATYNGCWRVKKGAEWLLISPAHAQELWIHTV